MLTDRAGVAAPARPDGRPARLAAHPGHGWEPVAVHMVPGRRLAATVGRQTRQGPPSPTSAAWAPPRPRPGTAAARGPRARATARPRGSPAPLGARTTRARSLGPGAMRQTPSTAPLASPPASAPPAWPTASAGHVDRRRGLRLAHWDARRLWRRWWLLDGRWGRSQRNRHRPRRP